MSKKAYLDELYARSKESVVDVTGWKIFIFLPHNFLWRLFLIATIILTFVMRSLEYSFRLEVMNYDYIEILFSVFYFVDTFCSALHYTMTNTRSLRHSKKKHPALIFIDFFTLIPFNIIYTYFILNDRRVGIFFENFRINVCMRIYQLFMFFYDSRFSLCKMKVYFLVILIQITLGLAIFTHGFACLYFLLLPIQARKECMTDSKNCIVQSELLIFSILSQCYADASFATTASESTFFTILTFILGFFWTYGYVLPQFFFAISYGLMSLIEFSHRCDELKLLTNNLTDNKSIRSKIVGYFQLVWIYGKGKRKPEILNVFPKTIQKNIFCDVHWEAFQHSHLLDELSLGCKRSLSLRMKADFVLPNTNLLTLSKKKINFMYLKSGLIQLMAEENDSSPVLTFSDGTVFGEVSFFFQLESKAILKTGKLSVIHFLHCRDFLKVLLKYPADMKHVFNNMKYRLAVAKATYVRKTQIFPYFIEDVTKTSEKGSVQWIKQQIRAITILKEACNNDKSPLEIQRRTQELHTQMEHTSLFLSLINVNDEIINKYETVCLSSRCPWAINSQSSFLRVWNYIIIFVSFMTAILYPAFIAWFPKLPNWFLSFTVLTSFFYILDVLIGLMTSTKSQHETVTKFKTIFAKKLTSLTFYVDVLAALPIHIIRYDMKDQDAPYILGLHLTNALLKIYKLVGFVVEWNYRKQSRPFIRTLLKTVFFLGLSIYWLGALLKLSGIDCIFYDCGNYDWHKSYKQSSGKHLNVNVSSIILVVYIAMDYPYEVFKTNLFPSYCLFFLSYILIRLYFFVWMNECIGSYVLERLYYIYYENLMKVVNVYMQKRKVTGRIPHRVMDTMKFQWHYDRGNYLTQKNRIVDDIPFELRDEMDKDSLFRTLQMCPLFKMEDEGFLMSLCRISQRIALPANSVLVTFGTQTMSVYVIHKGFVQLNSFLPKDAVGNIGTPLTLAKGTLFPFIVAFNQIPSFLVARTVSDCELIILNLEEILSAMVAHEMFRDVVVSLKAADFTVLTLAKPGLSIVGRTSKAVEKIRHMRSLNYARRLSYYFLDCTIDPYGKKYYRWELVRLSCILFGIALWPVFFGCMINFTHKIYFSYILLIVDSTALIDFYIRFHLCYYNSQGIYISHFKLTFLHYLTTSFILDVIAFCPCIHFIYLIYTNDLEFELHTVLIHIALRFASFYKFFGFVEVLRMKYALTYKFEFIKYLFFGLITLNCYVNISVYLFLTDNFFLKTKLSRESPIYEIYYKLFVINVQFILRMKYVLMKTSIISILYVTLFNMFSWIIEIMCHSFFVLKYLEGGINFSNYQYFLRSFRKFLNSQKIEEKFITEAVEYYEHIWKKKRGLEFEILFSRFPEILHEDLLFSVYKKTLSLVDCLSQANEALYRILARNVHEIYLKKGSTVVFQGQVTSDIYILHKGRCQIKKLSVVLFRGSMIGDIHREGLIQNTMMSKTHVILLRIPSSIFFLTLNNFSQTKKDYEEAVSELQDFVKSSFEEVEEEESEEEEEDDDHLIAVEEKRSKELEVKYEPMEGRKKEKKKVKSEKDKKEKMKDDKNKLKGIIYPDSVKCRVLNIIFLLTSYVSSIAIPIVFGIRFSGVTSLIFIYSLDLIWVFKIFITLRTAILNAKTGVLVCDKKLILRHYLRRFDGLILDVLSTAPFEMLATIYNLITKENMNCISNYFILRSLRYFYIQRYYRTEKRRLSTNVYVRWIFMFITKYFLMNFYASIIMSFTREKMLTAECQKYFMLEHWEAITYSYTCVINIYCGAGLKMCQPENYLESVIETIILMSGFYSKISLYTEGAIAIHLVYHAKFSLTKQMEELQSYLEVRDITPALLVKVKTYFTNLIDYCREGAMPMCLKTAPDFVKYHVMGDLYLHHLANCFVFADLEQTFLVQLTTRLQRFVFFPGNYLTKKGDVDQNMYFIHKGEVYCLEEDKNLPSLERPIDHYTKDENFGIMQGLFPCYPHSHTFRAKTLAEIMVLNFKDWEDMRLVYPDIAKVIYKRALQRLGSKKA